MTMMMVAMIVLIEYCFRWQEYQAVLYQVCIYQEVFTNQQLGW